MVHSEEENENKEKEDERRKATEEVEEEMESPDGRRRRRTRPPAKFAELVQVMYEKIIFLYIVTQKTSKPKDETLLEYN